ERVAASKSSWIMLSSAVTAAARSSATPQGATNHSPVAVRTMIGCPWTIRISSTEPPTDCHTGDKSRRSRGGRSVSHEVGCLGVGRSSAFATDRRLRYTVCPSPGEYERSVAKRVRLRPKSAAPVKARPANDRSRMVKWQAAKEKVTRYGSLRRLLVVRQRGHGLLFVFRVKTAVVVSPKEDLAALGARDLHVVVVEETLFEVHFFPAPRALRPHKILVQELIVLFFLVELAAVDLFFELKQVGVETLDVLLQLREALRQCVTNQQEMIPHGPAGSVGMKPFGALNQAADVGDPLFHFHPLRPLQRSCPICFYQVTRESRGVFLPERTALRSHSPKGLVLHTGEVLFGTGVDADDIARLHKERHLHHKACLQRRRLAAARRRIAPDPRFGVGHLELDKGRQFDADGPALVKLDVKRHVVLKEVDVVSQKVPAQGDLLI